MQDGVKKKNAQADEPATAGALDAQAVSFEPEPMPPTLVLDLTDDAAGRHMRVAGELDVSNAPQLQGRLLDVFQRGDAPVVIDLRELSFIDSTGLGVLVSARQRAKSTGVPVRLLLPEGSARFPFQVTGLVDAFDTDADE